MAQTWDTDAEIKEHISGNLSKLVECTEVNVKLRALLLENGIISKEEKLILQGSNLNKMESASKLYEIIETRQSRGYEVLLDALRETNQTEAYYILTKTRITDIRNEARLQEVDEYRPYYDGVRCKMGFCDIRYTTSSYSNSDSIDINFKIPVGCCRSKKVKRLLFLVFALVIILYLGFVWAYYLIGI